MAQFISIETNDKSRESAAFLADTLRELGFVARPSQAQQFRAAQSAAKIAAHLATHPPVPGTPEYMDVIRMKNHNSWAGSYMDTMEQTVSMGERGFIQFI
jgi:broad specificity phosphatase PhoE